MTTDAERVEERMRCPHKWKWLVIRSQDVAKGELAVQSIAWCVSCGVLMCEAMNGRIKYFRPGKPR